MVSLKSFYEKLFLLFNKHDRYSVFFNITFHCFTTAVFVDFKQILLALTININNNVLSRL